jgi:hypothetical protein
MTRRLPAVTSLKRRGGSNSWRITPSESAIWFKIQQCSANRAPAAAPVGTPQFQQATRFVDYFEEVLATPERSISSPQALQALREAKQVIGERVVELQRALAAGDPQWTPEALNLLLSRLSKPAATAVVTVIAAASLAGCSKREEPAPTATQSPAAPPQQQPLTLPQQRAQFGPPIPPPPMDGSVPDRSQLKQTEWPTAPTARDENHDLLFNRVPSDLLPEKFTHARRVRWGSPITGYLPDDQLAEAAKPWSDNTPADAFVPDPVQGGRYYNNILIAGSHRAGERPAVAAHELGHIVGTLDFTAAQRNEWIQIHQRVVQAAVADAQAAGLTSWETPAGKAILDRYPKAILMYGDRLDESFAELFGQYMANPSAFKAKYPDIYGWYHKQIGVEYIQKRGR